MERKFLVLLRRFRLRKERHLILSFLVALFYIFAATRGEYNAVCAKAQSNLIVLSSQELPTHWAFCLLRSQKSSMSLAKLQVFASHPARPARAQILAVFLGNIIKRRGFLPSLYLSKWKRRFQFFFDGELFGKIMPTTKCDNQQVAPIDPCRHILIVSHCHEYCLLPSSYHPLNYLVLVLLYLPAH